MIRLFESDVTSFTNFGFGVLSDAISCTVTEELNGVFELTMEYPVDGIHFSDIELRRIIVTKPNPFEAEQAFRIYGISKTINGRATISAEHISYDLSSVIVSIAGAPLNICVGQSKSMSYIEHYSTYDGHTISDSGFKFISKATENEDLVLRFTIPKSVRAALGGDEDSVLSTFGGELIFDNYNVTLVDVRGADRGIHVRYGRNMTDLSVDDNLSNTYTQILPYYIDDSNKACVGIAIPSNTYAYNFTKTLLVDLTNEFGNLEKNADNLQTVGEAYMLANDPAAPETNITVSFTHMNDVTNQLLDVRLGDVVHVEHTSLRVLIDQRCVKTTFDAIRERYESVELQTTNASIVKTLYKRLKK